MSWAWQSSSRQDKNTQWPPGGSPGVGGHLRALRSPAVSVASWEMPPNLLQSGNSRDLHILFLTSTSCWGSKPVPLEKVESGFQGTPEDSTWGKSTGRSWSLAGHLMPPAGQSKKWLLGWSLYQDMMGDRWAGVLFRGQQDCAGCWS